MQQRHIFTKIIICLAHKTRFNQTMNAVHKKSLKLEALKLKRTEKRTTDFYEEGNPEFWLGAVLRRLNIPSDLFPKNRTVLN